jgi:hypothetical protein
MLMGTKFCPKASRRIHCPRLKQLASVNPEQQISSRIEDLKHGSSDRMGRGRLIAALCWILDFGTRSVGGWF